MRRKAAALNGCRLRAGPTAISGAWHVPAHLREQVRGSLNPSVGPMRCRYFRVLTRNDRYDEASTCVGEDAEL
ncbi:hypothetical protein M2275_007236 [Rhodococcus opacus]|nr:hypothetical protein [Rhodococcus opacus]